MTTISPEQITSHLQKVLASAGFASSRRLRQFLRYVVEETLNGHADQIKQYTVGVEAMGFGEAFDPQSNPTVRIHANKLRRELDRYCHAEGHADPIHIEIPKGGYVPVFKEYPVASSAAETNQCTPTDPANAPLDASKPAIAIMMIDCLNGKDKLGHFASGLTEEILVALTKFSELLVVGPLSKEICHRKGLDNRGIGREYGTRFILNGTLGVKGDFLRLTVRLTDASIESQLWGNTLEWRIKNGALPLYYDDIASQVAAIIADNHGIIPRTMTKEVGAQHTGSSDAYEAILYYYHYFVALSQESFVNAMTALENTVQRYPDHPLAAAALSDLLVAAYLFGYDEDKSKIARAEALARKAMALDPRCQTARFTMALVHFLKFQRELFLAEADQAINLNPNHASYMAAIAMHMWMVGKWKNAIELVNRAKILNLHYPGWYHIVTFMDAYRQGEYRSALVEARRFNSPSLFWDPLIRAAVLGQLGGSMEAKTAVNELLALIPDFKNRGPSLIRRLAYTDEHVEMLLDGLRKAGMKSLDI